MANQTAAPGVATMTTTSLPSQPDPQQQAGVINQKTVAVVPSAAQPVTRVDIATQTDPEPSLGQRIVSAFTGNTPETEQQQTDAGIPANSTDSQTETAPVAGTEKAEKAGKTVVEFHKPNWKERVVATAKVVGSYLAVPLKLVADAVTSIVWKPLETFIITPIYVAGLYLFNRDRYDARAMDLQAQAAKAASERDQADDRALQRAYQVLARQAVDADDHRAEMEKYKPGQRVNKEFRKKLADGALALRKQLPIDPATGEKSYITQTVHPASDQLLDTEKAAVAKRVGNDPALRTALEAYNQAVAAHQQAVAEHAKVVEQAGITGEPAPDAPVLTTQPPRFKCTDKNMIEAYNRGSEKHLANLKAKVEELPAEIDQLKADFKAAYPGNPDAEHFIQNAGNSDAYKAIIEDALNSCQQQFRDQEQALAEAENNGNELRVPQIQHALDGLGRAIDIYQRHLTIYEKECELASAMAEVEFRTINHSQLQNAFSQDIDEWENGVFDAKTGEMLQAGRDRLNTRNWKSAVTRDGLGNITSDPKQASHLERVFDSTITPAYNGKAMPNPVPYQDQKGLSWRPKSPEQYPYDSYTALRGGDNEIRKDRQGNIVGWEAAPGRLNNHWVVKPDHINGKHEGYDKFELAVKTPAQQSENPFRWEQALPEFLKAPLDPKPASTLGQPVQQARRAFDQLSAEMPRRRADSLTIENLARHNQMTAENSSDDGSDSHIAPLFPGQDEQETRQQPQNRYYKNETWV